MIQDVRLPLAATVLVIFVALVPSKTIGSRAGADSANCGGDYCNFNVLVVPFESTDSHPVLGANVAQALQHQIFRQLLVNVPIVGSGTICCLPADTIVLGEQEPLFLQTHEAAVARGLDVPEGVRFGPSQLVVWGKAWLWRDRVVVQSFLSVLDPPSGLDPLVEIGGTDIPPNINAELLTRRRPFNNEGEWRLWEILLDADNSQSGSLYIDSFPSSLYGMPQISLDADDVEEFRSLDDLNLYAFTDGEFRSISTRLDRPTIQAVEHRGEYTRVADPFDLWIRLPSVEVGVIDDFVGGVFHFLRGNWERASINFETVAADESAPSSVRVDASLLLAATRYRLDPACSNCPEAIALARAINPYSPIAAKFEFMTELAQALADEGDVLSLRERLEQEPALFDPQDRFTIDANRFLENF